MVMVILSILTPALLGLSVLRLLSRNRDVLPVYAEVSLAFGLGMGILAQYMLILGALHLRYTFATLVLPVLLITPALFLRGKHFRTDTRKKTVVTKKPAGSIVKYFQKIGTLKTVFMLSSCTLIALFFTYAFSRALTLPVYTRDALAIMVFKSKIIYYERTLDYLRNCTHPSYPLQVPFMIDWISIFSGKWNDFFFKALFPATLLCFVAFFYHFLRSYTSRLRALFGVMLLLSGNLLILHSTIAYRDLIQMYYVCTSLMLLALWDAKEENRFLILAALFSGFTTFIKLEGSAYLALLSVIFLVLLFQKKNFNKKFMFQKFLTYFIPSCSIFLFYSIYKIYAGIPPGEKPLIDLKLGNLEKIPYILLAFLNDLLLSGNWNILWFILFISILVNSKNLFRVKIVGTLTLALFLFFGLYFASALITPNFEWLAGPSNWSTLPRIILHFFPLCPMLIVLLNNPKND